MKKILAPALRYSSALIFFLTIITCDAQSYQWKSLSMGGGGFVSGIITSKQEQNLMYCRTDVGGAYKWNATTSSWAPLLDWASATQSGFYGVESIAIDPRATNKLYLYVGINYFDNGKTAILKSDDYGQTFTTIDVTAQFKAHGNGMGRSNGERLQVDPNLGSTLYAGTRYNGLWKSTTSGTTWSRLNGVNVNTTPNGNGISFVTIDRASGTNGNASQTIYVGVSVYDTIATNLYKSTDGGNTFSPVTGGPTGFMPQRAVLNSNKELVINYANGSGPYGTTFTGSNEPMGNGGIWKYNTVSGVWTNITPAGIAKAWGGITVDPNNPNRMMASTINNYQLQYGNAYGDRIYLTTNGGASWTDVVARGFVLNSNGAPWIIGQAIHWAGSVEFDPFNTGRVFVSSGNGIFSNDNIDVASTQWKFEINGLEETVPSDIVSMPGGALFTTIADYDGFKFTDLTQYGQRYTPAIGTTTGIAAAANAPYKIFRVGSSMYYSTDQGANWTKTTAVLPGTTAGSQGKLTVSADGNTILYCPNGSSLTYYSTDNGGTWTASTINVSNAVPVADKVNSSKFYIYNSGSGNVNVSTNGGVSFTVTVNVGAGGSKIIRTIPGLEGHIWVPLYGGGLRRSINSGTTFTTVSSVSACSAIGYGKAAPGATYLTLYIWGTVNGVTGIFRSTDEGATWVRINDDAHQYGGPGNAQFVMGDMNTYGVVYMSTVGRGVIVGQDQSALPVSLVSLNVQEAQQNSRRLAVVGWKTLSENNTDHFDIERSTTVNNWKSVGSVSTKALNGNSTASLIYNYPDDIAGLSGTINYRLKMADKDGRFTYSSVVSLKPGTANEAFSLSVSPNPVVSKTGVNLHFASAKNQQVFVKIMSANGTVISTKYFNLLSGSTSMNIPDLQNKAAGVYTVSVVSAETNKSLGSTKFLIQ